MFTAKRNGSHCLHPPLSGCSQGPFFDTICHCLVFIFNVIMMMKDSSNSLCQLFYHGHCLLLSLYICVISLKCNGNADFCLLVSFFFLPLLMSPVCTRCGFPQNRAGTINEHNMSPEIKRLRSRSRPFCWNIPLPT